MRATWISLLSLLSTGFAVGFAFAAFTACLLAPRRRRAHAMDQVKAEAGAPSDELAALRDSELRMQRRLTEQRRRESKVVLRAAVCESEKRKLSETVSGLQRAVQPAQKQVRTLMLDPSVNAEIMRLREQVVHALRSGVCRHG